MRFERLSIERREGPQPSDAAFVEEVHAMTRLAGGPAIEMPQTRERMERATLGHYVYLDQGGGPRLVAYSLNEIYDARIDGVFDTVNYFCSAFILPELRTRYSLYRLLAALRVSGGEPYVLMRTQSPVVMRSFLGMCQQHGYVPFTALSSSVPREVQDIVQYRFQTTELVHRAAYPGRVSPPGVPPTGPSADLMKLIDPDRGDACVFVGVRAGFDDEPTSGRWE